MGGDSKSSDIRFDGSDRHHVIKMGLPDFDMKEEPKKPVTAIDFYLEPFNRHDTYTVDIYFTYEKEQGAFQLSSSHPIKFVEKGVAAEKAKDIALRVLTEMVRKGFFRI